MQSVELYPHQREALAVTKGYNRVAYYHDMGLGKTFTGAEKLMSFDRMVNLIICQKSKISDWLEHMTTYYHVRAYDLTKAKQLDEFYDLSQGERFYVVGVINYELAWRRTELTNLHDFSLLLDESSLIQNEKAKRSKFILKKLKPDNVILLSGTPTGGKYENLWSQMRLLGWEISKDMYWSMFIRSHYEDYGGFPHRVVDGYKNVDRLKRKMREYGCHFLKTDEVMDLPEQVFTTIKVDSSKEYRKFRKTRVVEVDDDKLVADNTLTAMLYERQLCGQYSKDKLNAFEDLLESTDDRLIVFYNFTAELEELLSICDRYNRLASVVNGKMKCLEQYETNDSSVTFVQYQAGAMGLNLQKANKIIYYTPPLSSELYEQSKKRIHRIGQTGTCHYYNLTVKDSVEEKIYKVLAMRKDFTEALFNDEI